MKPKSLKELKLGVNHWLQMLSKKKLYFFRKNEVEIKDVTKYISNIGKTYFIEQYNKF